MDQQKVYSRCENCGGSLEPGSKFCTFCGQSVHWQGAQPVNPVSPVQDDLSFAAVGSMSKEAYRKVCKNEKYLNQIKAAAIICYVCAGINAVLGLVTMSILPFIDIAITMPLAVIMHTKKSKGCAIALLVYAIIGMVVNLVLNGIVGGWLWLVAGVSAVTAFSVCDKEYEAAKLNGQF